MISCLGEAQAEPAASREAYGTPVYVICNVGVNVRPINCFPCLCLHLFHPLVGSTEVCKGAVGDFLGEILRFPSGEYWSLGKLIPGAPEVPNDSWDLPVVVWPSPEG